MPVSTPPRNVAPSRRHSTKLAPKRLVFSKVEFAKSLPACSDPFSCAFAKSHASNVQFVVRMLSRFAPRKLQRTKRWPSSSSPSASMSANASSSASRGRSLTASLVPHLAEQALEPLFGRVVDERHRGSDVRMHLGDCAEHLLSDCAIR